MEYRRLKYEECRDDVSSIRRKVFIEEQNCPEEMEWDENEEKDSLYFVAFQGGVAVGCLRLRNIEPDLLKMERVAVLKEHRRRGIASEMIREAQIHAQTEAPESSIYAYAQVSAIQAYVSLGFTVVSKVWIEDGTFIPHQTIIWGTPVTIDVFLKHQSKKNAQNYEEYDVRAPAILPKVQAYLERLTDVTECNVLSLHLLLDDVVVSKFARKGLAKLCRCVADYVQSFENRERVVEQSDFLLRLADTRLNTGHFSKVDENWRKLYALISYLQAFVLLKENRLKKAVIIADKGLCMGRIDERRVPLRALAALIHERLPKPDLPINHLPERYFKSIEKEQKLSPNQNSSPIEECENDESTFVRLVEAVVENKPLLVRRFASDMPAVGKWNLRYLYSQLHTRTFPVEVGKNYSDEDWSQRMMTFAEFVANSENEQLYLAQHRLLDQVPHLNADIVCPDICFGESTNVQDVDMNMWIGPAGTISPLHTDPRKNMFVQVHGTKLFRLVSPDESATVYPIEGMLSNTSQVDVENPDLSEFPEFGGAHVLDAVVNEGDALFIPAKWWHYVRSTKFSVSISFWFD
ncbi:unnamed protein product [Caenorhabditis sp. 36 PRJEB53466]|nr:unnamed protein product [Caenorhabditis sp. 36 PRJEB53466]